MSVFNFATAENEYIYSITPNIILHLYRTNHAVAMLYLTDENNNKIEIPFVFKIYVKDFSTNKQVPMKQIDKNIYALCFTDDYIIEFNNFTILYIKQKRAWDITIASEQTV